MREFLESKSPTKEYDEFKKARLIYPECTSQEEETIKRALQPCGDDVALGLFFRYLVSHGFKEQHPNQEKRDIIRSDFLAHMSICPEYVVTLALIDYLETSEKPWFPTVGFLITMLGKHKLYEPKIMRWERGFCTKEEIAESQAWSKDVDMDALVDKIRKEARQEREEQNN